MNRTVGIILVVAAAGICLLTAVFLGTGLAAGNLTTSGAVLGVSIVAVVLVLPLGGFGIFTIVRGRQEQATQAESADLRKILDMVSARGQVQISDVVIELGSDTQKVRDMVYHLVGMGVFSGYINWDEGTLYSAEAAGLRNLTNCRNCGGQIQLAGKGVAQCPHCGTEYFLS